MVGAGEVATHQSSRDEGSVFGIAVISGGGHQSSLDRDVRQLDGCGLRQQAGWDSVPLPLLVGQSPSEVEGESRRPPRCEVSTRAVQCSGRSPQASGSGYRNYRQVASAQLLAWGSPSLDLFATRLNAKLPLYCSLVPDPQAVFEDAFHHPWDNLDVYAFPPFPLVGRVVARVRETPNLSMTLVAPLWPEMELFANFVDLLLLLTQPPFVLPWWDRLLRQPHFNRFHQGVHTLNLHAWRDSSVSSESRAFREDLLEMSGCVRTSTSRLYQGQWMLFCGWCRGRGVAPVNATFPLTVDFRGHLRSDKGLSVSVVKGYWSALNSVFALKGMDLADSRKISMLLRSFSKSARPAWDVTLILQSLTRALYDPLRSSDERFLAQKMLFLLALALAKRVGELHTLSNRVSHSRG